MSAAIADVYERNIGAHVFRQSVVEIDPAELPTVDWFHASPTCKNFSRANVNGCELEIDIGMAHAVGRYIDCHRPAWVSIENVWTYRNSQSWREIYRSLRRNGYGIRTQKVNMADYGVPQTRIRMIVTAFASGRIPPILHPTHEKTPTTAAALFDVALPRWNGWYAAIEDLIPDLPDSEFADWQLKDRQLKALLAELVQMANGNASTRALLVDSAGYPDPKNGGARVAVHRYSELPANCIVANHARRPMRAFIINSGNASRDLTILDECQPMFTITNVKKSGSFRAFIQYRTVKMTPRALARLQSIPDGYVLPENNGVAYTGIGNGTPCLFIEIMARQLAGKAS